MSAPRRVAGTGRRVVRVIQERHALRRAASRDVRAGFALDRGRIGERAGALLVAPPGDGNIGDQAMVDAFVENTVGPVVLVVRRPGDLVVRDDLADRVRVVALPDLIFRGSRRTSDLADYRRLVSSVEHVAVVGADMMDGVYTRTGSVHRALLAELAALSGVPTRILGFSWSSGAAPVATAALRRAAGAGAVPVARDPASAARLRLAGVPGVVDGSDIVFSSRTTVPGAVAEVDRSRPFALLNISALVGRSVPAAAYDRVVKRLCDAGLAVVLVPHVLRASSDDLTACRAVHERHPDTVLIDRRLSPAEVCGLAADARAVVTGRMHLAIMAATGGVPAITLATSGKVEGLTALLGIESFCVDPGPDLADRVVPLLDEVLTSGVHHERLAARLPSVRALAAANLPHAALPPAAIPTAS